ncbi:MAG: hypothetical protein R2755_33395 [Acidimicrobiales bacterium]
MGKHCESGDILLHDAALPADLRVDDLLATPVTGAYGFAMGSNYNRLGRPAVVFVGDGRHRPRRAPGDHRGSAAHRPRAGVRPPPGGPSPLPRPTVPEPPDR